MTEEPEEVPLAGEASEVNLVALAGVGDVVSPDCRRSLRKRSLRSPSSRGCLAKVSPKSPLMRMAEMRKGGLRGRALRQSGKKGFAGHDSKAGIKKKGIGGEGLSLLAVILEDIVLGDGSRGVEGLEGSAGDSSLVISGAGEMIAGDGIDEGFLEGAGAEVVDVRGDRSLVIQPDESRHIGKPEEVLLKQKELIPSGNNADLVLDLISSQPLQEMAFIGEQMVPEKALEDPGKDCLMLDQNQFMGNGNYTQECNLGTGNGS